MTHKSMELGLPFASLTVIVLLSSLAGSTLLGDGCYVRQEAYCCAETNFVALGACTSCLTRYDCCPTQFDQNTNFFKLVPGSPGNSSSEFAESGNAGTCTYHLVTCSAMCEPTEH